VTVGRETDKVKPNGEKRVNLPAAARGHGVLRPSVPGHGKGGRAGDLPTPRPPWIAATASEMPLDTDIV
jgi:hypothetical protein